MDLLHNKRIRFALVIVTILALTITTEKWQEMGGKRGKLTLLKCLDMGSGTVSCAVKEGVKLYLYFHNVRGVFVEKVRRRAMEAALVDALGQGMSPGDAARQAQRDRAKAARVAKRRARHVIGPIVSAMWDMLEVGYYGGSKVEGIVRGFGTLCGTHAGGLVGEQRLGRVGYVVGSHLGSWFGGRVGLMVYDVFHGIDYLIRFVVGPQNHNAELDKLCVQTGSVIC